MANWCKMVFISLLEFWGSFGFESVIVFIIDSALLEPKGGIKTIEQLHSFDNSRVVRKKKRKELVATHYLIATDERTFARRCAN